MSKIGQIFPNFFFLLTEKQTDIDQKIRDILESVAGLKSLSPPPEM